MFLSHFYALALLTITAAVPTSPGATQLGLNIAQKPLRVEPRVSAPDVSPLEETDASSPVSLLYEFSDKEVTLENVAARSNGHLLLTATSHPTLFTFDPDQRNASLLYTFPNSTSTLGIVEAAPDVFIVAVGNYTTDLKGIGGSFSVWSVDLTDSNGEPIVKKITDIPEAQALNGMTKIEGSSELVLIADSVLGGIWKVDYTSGKYSMAIQNNLFSINNLPFPLGINGIRTRDQQVYFVNSAQRLYGYIAIDKSGGAIGQPKIIANSLPAVLAWDDFAMDGAGNGWIATHPNAVTKVTQGGIQRNFTAAADASYTMRQPTSLSFGRGTTIFEKTLFVVTAGAPGQIFTIDTSLL